MTEDQHCLLSNKWETYQVVYSNKANWDDDVLIQVVEETRSIDCKAAAESVAFNPEIACTYVR